MKQLKLETGEIIEFIDFTIVAADNQIGIGTLIYKNEDDGLLPKETPMNIIIDFTTEDDEQVTFKINKFQIIQKTPGWADNKFESSIGASFIGELA